MPAYRPIVRLEMRSFHLEAFFFNFEKEKKKLVEETAISRWSAIVGSWDPHPRDVIQGVGN